MPRFLLVTKEYAESPTSGGMQRSKAIAQSLSKYGDVVVVYPGGTLRREQGQVLGVLPMAPADHPFWRLVCAYRSVSGAKIGGALLLKQLERALSQRYDLAVIDHTCLFGLRDIIGNYADRVVASMHNVESKLMHDRARTAGWRTKPAMRAEAFLLERLEGQLLHDVIPTMVVSRRDAQQLGSPQAFHCPNGVFEDRIVVPEGPLNEQKLLFAGALDWQPNAEGLCWFVWHHWPRVRSEFPDAQLTIAGRNPGELVRGLAQHPGVTVIPDPTDMRDLMTAHGIGIVPLLTGGGSRIKILEYLSTGMDVVSTHAGAAGLEDIPDELIDRGIDVRMTELLMLRMKNPRDNRVAATDWVRNHYTWDRTMYPLEERLQQWV